MDGMTINHIVSIDHGSYKTMEKQFIQTKALNWRPGRRVRRRTPTASAASGAPRPPRCRHPKKRMPSSRGFRRADFGDFEIGFEKYNVGPPR